jgi:hypothetical protein
MSDKSSSTPPNKSGAFTNAARKGVVRVRRVVSGATDQVARAGLAARDVAHVAAGATANAAKVAVDATTEFASKTGKFLDQKSRELLAKEFEKNRPLALATVVRLRKAHRGAKPAEIIEILSAEFMKSEKEVSAESEKFLAASTHYVITLSEIYGDKVRDNTQRQILLYLVLAANSKAAKVITQVGVVALTFASKRFAAIASVVAIGTEFLKRSAGKMSWVSALATLAGISNVGRKSASWVVVNASLKILGPAPALWPAAGKKPVAKKRAAQNPVSRTSHAAL